MAKPGEAVLASSETLEPGRLDRNQHPRRLASLVAEGVQLPDRHADERARPRHDALVVHQKRDLAFQHVETLDFARVDVRRRAAAGENQTIEQRQLARGVGARGQVAVDIAHHGHGAAAFGAANER